jgi:hypothetical protein
MKMHTYKRAWRFHKRIEVLHSAQRKRCCRI